MIGFTQKYLSNEYLQLFLSDNFMFGLFLDHFE